MIWDFKRWLNHPLFVPGLVSLAVLIGLYGAVPYGMGYGSKAVSIFENLWWMWQETPEWEHCQLVPLIALAIVYWKREEALGREIDFRSKDFIVFASVGATFAVSAFEDWPFVGSLALLVLVAHVFLGGGRFSRVLIKGNNAAAALLVLAMAIYWIGYKIDIVQMSFLSLHFTLGALILWFYGGRFFLLVSFPFLFLLFAWPMPFLDMIAFKLRVLMSAFSHVFLNLIGINAIRVGTAIVSAPDFSYGIPQGVKFSLDVADPCSGIRSLFALTMVTALWSYFTQKIFWKQWFLFLCAVPLAVAGNFCRILMLTFGTLLLGSDFAIGTVQEPSIYHMLSGYVVFIVALGGMLLVGWILNGGWKILLAIIGVDAGKGFALKKSGAGS